MATEEEDRFKDIMNRLGESSSLHGIPKILTSRQVVVKFLWCLLLIGAVALFCVQFRGLILEYYSYPTQTTSSLQFSPLPLPAVTFCNMNPMKKSFAISGGKYDKISVLITDEYLDSYLGTTDRRIPDTIVFSDADYREFNNSKDEFEAWKTRLLTEIRKLADEDKREAGHQLRDFIHSVTFSGNIVPIELFKTTWSHKYGNCFTLDNVGIIAHGSGHSNSLHVLINIESFEYMHQFSSAFGVRMVLHEKDTHPFADEEGITMSSNYETYIGLRLTKISRLGGKYSECTLGDAFTKKYTMKYTVPVCYSTCQTEKILRVCNCIPMSSDIVSNMSARICDFDDAVEWRCLEKVISSIYDGIISCDCKSRCNQDVYSSTISGRIWPHSIYMEKVLVKETCKRSDHTSIKLRSICTHVKMGRSLTSEMIEELSKTFLSVYIYYEDLNHETIFEEPLYNTVRFLSDIGGALGLFLGASFLTMVELLQVLLEIVLHLRRKCKAVSPAKDTDEEIVECSYAKDE